MVLPSLRLSQILHDEADGLCGEELGMGRLVTPRKSLSELFAVADPAVQAVQRHMWAGIREIEHRQLRFCIASYNNSLCSL